MKSNEYFDKLDQALSEVKQAITATELEKTDEFDTTNYSEILSRLYSAKKSIEKMMVAYRYFKLSKEAFIKMSEAKGNRRMEVVHTVKSFETVHSIAAQYGITVEDVLRKNNLLASDLTAGLQIKVEVRESRTLNKIFEEIPVFGDQTGILALGKDLTNELREDNTGDLYVLGPEDTLKQGVKNRISTKAGDYPMEWDFGISDVVGGELPSDLNESYYKLKLVNQLEQDKRLVSIDSLEVTRKGNAIIYDGHLTAVNNKDLVIP